MEDVICITKHVQFPFPEREYPKYRYGAYCNIDGLYIETKETHDTPKQAENKIKDFLERLGIEWKIEDVKIEE